MIKSVTNKILKFEKNIKLHYDLINENSFGLSGKCSVFISPKNIKNFVKILKICNKVKVKYFVLGSGTNVVVLNEGYSGIVICTKKLNKIYKRKNKVYAQCGVNLFKLNDFAVENGLSGLEFSYGIPGSVGGATAMNAGAFGSEFKNNISKVWAFNGKKMIKLQNEQCEFEYRTSIFQNNIIVLKIELNLIKSEKDEIQKKCLEYFKIKKENQPYNEKSAGSFFKRKENIIVSKLIDEMGFKGESVGGAMVSTVHAGFIVNKNNATSDDVLQLAEIISKKVAKVHKIDLQLEVKLLGDFNEDFRRLPHTHAVQPRQGNGARKHNDGKAKGIEGNCNN